MARHLRREIRSRFLGLVGDALANPLRSPRARRGVDFADDVTELFIGRARRVGGRSSPGRVGSARRGKASSRS
jgi:hypothetical protein